MYGRKKTGRKTDMSVSAMKTVQASEVSEDRH